MAHTHHHMQANGMKTLVVQDLRTGHARAKVRQFVDRLVPAGDAPLAAAA